MARRSGTRSKGVKRRRRKSGILRSLLIRFLVWGIVLVSLGVVVGFLWIDNIVRDRFDRQLWEIPVHIYSRSFELYPGLTITRDRLESRLQGLGYRHVSAVEGAGEFRLNSESIDLVTREFTFWDGPQKSRSVRVKFNSSTIGALTDRRSGQSIPVLRLKPHLIGSLSQIQHEDRYLVRLGDTSQLLLATLIAVEDRRFMKHHGVDLRAILRASWANLTAGRIVEGGSTLTQQLIKNVYGRDERTYRRKLLEVAMALVVEYRLQKHEILEAYSNEVFLGQDGKRAIHGFGLGSQYLFGRPVSELNVAEVAQVVGMIKAPSSYDPLRNPERAKQRRTVVLNIMRSDGLISDQEYQKFVNSSLDVISANKRKKRNFASFVDVVLRRLSDKVNSSDLTRGDFSVFTTMDIEVQRAAERVLSTELTAIEKNHGIPDGTLQGGIVVVRPDDGELLAVAGGRNSYVGAFNRAIDIRRPIGSLVKPFIYLTAFMQGKKWTLSTLVSDRPVTLKLKDGQKWSPKNFDEEFQGEITVLDALAKSRNVPAVRVGMKVGVESVADNLRKLGADLKGPIYPSMLLGAVELSPLQVAQIYQTLANYGYKIGLKAISTVSADARELTSASSLQATPAVPADLTYLTMFAMQEAVARGTGRRLLNSFTADLKIAGKTGTTDDFRDSWFVGISGNLLAVVWLGRDDNKSTGLTGSSGALRVWASMMKQLNLQALNLSSVREIDYVDIDLNSGLIAATGCTNVRSIPFLRGTAPRRRANCEAESR